jgi:hypothetical protein
MNNKQTARQRRRAPRKQARKAELAKKIGHGGRILVGPHLSGAELAAAIKRPGTVVSWPDEAHVWVAEEPAIFRAEPPDEWHCVKCGLPWNGSDWWLDECSSDIPFKFEGWIEAETVFYWLFRRIAFNWANRDRTRIQAGAVQFIAGAENPVLKRALQRLAQTLLAEMDEGIDGPLGWCATVDRLNALAAGLDEEVI